jgi:hypothetical protein
MAGLYIPNAEELKDFHPTVAAAIAGSIAIHGEAARMRQIRHDYIATYRLDFERWIRDIIIFDPLKPNDKPTDYQLFAAKMLVEKRRISMVGPHGLGKSAWFAWSVQWFATTRDGADEFGFLSEWKIRTTAGSWRQLTDFLWPEIRTKWTHRLRWDLIGRRPWELGKEVIQTKIEGKTGQAAAAASSDPKLIEGAHADSIYYLLDESKAIPAEIFDGVEGAMSGGGEDTGNEAFIAAHSTPGDESGRFYEIHNDRDRFSHWFVIPVSFEETVKAKRNSDQWRVDMARVYGVKNPVYINRVLGKFAKDRSDGVIPTSWVEAAMERWSERGTLVDPVASDDVRRHPAAPTALGVDPNDSGEDPACIAKLYGDWLAPLVMFRSDEDLEEGEDDPGVMALVDEVLLHTGGQRLWIVVDAIGPGAGVYSRLRQKRGKAVISFKASERPPATRTQVAVARKGDLLDIDTYRNARGWLWWSGRKALDPANGRKLALPPDKELLGELVEMRWWEGSNGAIEVDNKDDIRKKDRLGRSTNRADAFLQALAAQELARKAMAASISAGPVNLSRRGAGRTEGPKSRWDERRQSATIGPRGRPRSRFADV